MKTASMDDAVPFVVQKDQSIAGTWRISARLTPPAPTIDSRELFGILSSTELLEYLPKGLSLNDNSHVAFQKGDELRKHTL